MAAGIAVSHQLPRPRVKILLAKTNTLAKGRRNRRIQYLDAAARPRGDFDAIERRRAVGTTRRDRPNLPGRQGISVDSFVAVQLGRRDELLDALHAHEITEMGVAELGLEAALLLFFDPAPGLQGNPDDGL